MLGHLLSHALISTGSGALRAGPLLSVAIATARSHSTRAGLVRVLDVHAGSAAVSTVSTTCRGPSCPSSSLPRRAPSSTQAASTDSGASVLQIEVELCSSCGLLHVTGHRLAHRSHTSPVSPSRPPFLPWLALRLMRSCVSRQLKGRSVRACGLRAVCCGRFAADGAAKFAVKGFTEALIVDFSINAPHLSAFLVMPGFVGTSIGLNSVRLEKR